MNQNNEKDETRHGLIIGGIILIGIGGVFLAINMGWMPFVGDSWPVIPIIVGIALIIGAFTRSREKKDESTP